MNETNEQKRSDVLNDDVLSLILGRLDINQVFALQRVSQQFLHCLREVLFMKREVAIGFNSGHHNYVLRDFRPQNKVTHCKRIDITPALAYKGVDLMNRKEWRLESMVDHFRDVNSLYLSSTLLNAETIELLVNRWPHLRKLYIDNITINGWRDPTVADQWAQLMSKFTHIIVGKTDGKYVPFMTSLIKKLPLLQSLKICDLSHNGPNIEVETLAKYLPAKIRSLDFTVSETMGETEAIRDITSQCTQIRKLSLSYHRRANHSGSEQNIFNEWFALICDRLQRLKRLKIVLDNISMKDFADSIVKLKHLRDLILRGRPFHLNCMCFDTQAMAAHMKPMQSLRSLSLSGLRCSPNRWSNMAEMFPNVRQLSVGNMYWHIDCDNEHECDQCFHQCMDCVSKLPQLKHISICNFHYFISYDIPRQTLDLFAGVDRLNIHLDYNYESYESDVIGFLNSKPVANRGRVFHLVVSSGGPRFMEGIHNKRVQIPDNVIVSESNI